MDQFHIIRYVKGHFDSVISGCGRNKGTLDSTHSKRSAQRHAKALRIAQPGFEFRVEPQFG